MNALLQRQDSFNDTNLAGVQELTVRETGDTDHRDQAGAQEFPALKQLSLAVLQMTNGSVLGRSILMRIEPKITLPFGRPLPFSTYAVVLHAGNGAMLLAGDESVNIRSGEIWWVDLAAEAHLINKSEDEIFLLLVDVRIDP